MAPRTPVDQAALAVFCRRHRIRKLSLFGSVLRDDFRPDSDIDVLVEFDPDARIGLYEFLDAQEELEAILGRAVDLVQRSALRNPFRHREILRTAEDVYAA